VLGGGRRIGPFRHPPERRFDSNSRTVRRPWDSPATSAPSAVQPATRSAYREFRKLDEELNITRRDLLNRHKRELELERSLQRAERLATIGTLASGLAHEIGTPMGVIRGRSELMLRSEQMSEGIRRGLEVIVSQIDRASRMVRMLLDYARARESHRSVCEIRQIVNNALSLIDTESERRNVKVFTSLGEQPPISECDTGQLRQVFENLEINVPDAMTPKGCSLRISATAESIRNGRGLR
jgi:two-component system, NtrC family, sensor histidine kinase HydH